MSGSLSSIHANQQNYFRQALHKFSQADCLMVDSKTGNLVGTDQLRKAYEQFKQQIGQPNWCETSLVGLKLIELTMQGLQEGWIDSNEDIRMIILLAKRAKVIGSSAQLTMPDFLNF